MSDNNLNAAQLQEQLDKSPSDFRVTKEQIERRIASVDYQVLAGSTVTMCNITLDNGFSVQGASACIDPTNFNADIGNTIAYNNAFQQLWPLFGFAMQELKFRYQTQSQEHDFLHATGDTTPGH